MKIISKFKDFYDHKVARPAECRIFARFVLGRLLAEAKAEGVEAEIISETADKHGMMSAVLKLDGKYAETLAQRWQGSLAPSVRNIRVKTGISAFSVCPICLKCRLKAKLSFKPVVRAVKAGSTSIKLKVPSVPLIKRAVFLCGSKANAVSMPTKNWL